MTVRDRIRAAATPRAILLAGWIGFMLYAYPGFLTTEAADELFDSRVGAFTDWHSPVMTEIWRWIGYVASGPPPILVVQSALLLAGVHHLLLRAMSPRASAIAAVALLWFPPVLATTAVICPESLLAAFLAAGAAAIASTRRMIQLAGLGLLLLACGLREGSSVAVLPILLVGLPWRAQAAAWQRPLLAAGTWLVLVVGASWLQRAVTDVETGTREMTLATRDIAGVLRFAGPIDDAELAEVFDGVPLIPAEHRLHDVPRWYVHPDELSSGPHRLFDRPESADARDRISAARGRLVRAHLGAYLQHRWRTLALILWLTRTAPRAPVYTQFTETPEQRVNVQFTSRFSVVQRQLVHAVRAQSSSSVFHPYVYFFVALIALPLAMVRRQRDAAMLLGSAIGYELALMFLNTSTEYRCSHWMIVGTLVAVFLMVARGISSRAAR